MEAQASFSQMAIESLEIAANVDPYQSDLQVGVEIPAVLASGWVNGQRNVDIRPRLVDSSSGEARLIDTGAQISATRRLPGDKVDESLNLVAVNGSKINTYGQRVISFKIGRKTYQIQAVICDVTQDILGSDFISKYKLNLEWDEETRSELSIVDKKAKISQELRIVTVPTNIVRAHHLQPSNASQNAARVSQQTHPPLSRAHASRQAAIIFEVACMKELGKSPELSKNIKSEDALKIHDVQYQNMIKTHPQLLAPSFKGGTPTHGVYHRIDTADHAPCKAKRRPIPMDSEKAKKGKEVWDQMEKDGVIERVKANSNTDWSSALHLVDKPGGGVRPCSDFRLLNQKTVTDAHPLPLLRDFTSKVHGSKVFSKVDLRSAFFNIPIWPKHKHKTLTLSPWGGS